MGRVLEGRGSGCVARYSGVVLFVGMGVAVVVDKGGRGGVIGLVSSREQTVAGLLESGTRFG